MDTRNRASYGRVKIDGVAKDELFNDGLCVIRLLQSIEQYLRKAPNRYQGIDIRIEFDEMQLHVTDQEKGFKEVLHGIADLIEPATAEDEELAAIGSPSDQRSPNYDPLYAEWTHCFNAKHRERKTPEELTLLRRHIESKYSGTRWWNGTHKW